MGMSDKYWPHSFTTDDPCPDPVSWINEPVPPDNVSAMPVRANQRSLHSKPASSGSFAIFAAIRRAG